MNINCPPLYDTTTNHKIPHTVNQTSANKKKEICGKMTLFFLQFYATQVVLPFCTLSTK